MRSRKVRSPMETDELAACGSKFAVISRGEPRLAHRRGCL